MNFMYKEFLTTLGFGNLYQGNEIVGFQFKFTIPYYRGVWLSQISGGFMVKVDNIEYPLDKVSIKIQDRVVPWAEVDSSYDLFWPYGTYATVMIDKPGGLAMGLHKVEVGLSIRRSYLDEDPAAAKYYDFWGRARVQAAPSEGGEESEAAYNPMSALQSCAMDMVLVM